MKSLLKLSKLSKKCSNNCFIIENSRFKLSASHSDDL